MFYDVDTENRIEKNLFVRRPGFFSETTRPNFKFGISYRALENGPKISTLISSDSFQDGRRKTGVPLESGEKLVSL